VVHEFPATIQWNCVKEIIALVRKDGDLSTEDKLHIGQHIAWFWGCALSWYEKRENDPDNQDASLLEKLLDLFNANAYGSSPKKPEALCDELEAVMNAQYASPNEVGINPAVVIQVITLLIQLWRELR
jgi:hypothetical protein